MKSLIQEAPSIIKAIQQAWDKAGNPAEFSVKVMEREEKNFLGMTRKPAVISFFFDPSLLSAPKHHRKKEHTSETPFEDGKKRSSHHTKEGREQRQEGRTSSPAHNQSGRPANSEHSKRTQENSSSRTHNQSQPQEQNARSAAPQVVVEDEHTGVLKAWLEEIITLLNVPATVSLKQEARAIIFTFDIPLLEQTEEENQLYASLAFLLTQGLKKKYRTRFRGFKFILRSPRTQKKAL